MGKTLRGRPSRLSIPIDGFPLLTIHEEVVRGNDEIALSFAFSNGQRIVLSAR